ncbi:hypothetical protein BB560_003619 [Smittium megazygosporum]|uniref:Uncharacterized protein n=1 Tax=Smittium megazygosporum TaxID=133381 RepID=A0A2T9ZBI9_9FUNG|nr:hypothetical protein BB560_003619 [Smittium megazygosporum]
MFDDDFRFKYRTGDFMYSSAFEDKFQNDQFSEFVSTFPKCQLCSFEHHSTSSCGFPSMKFKSIFETDDSFFSSSRKPHIKHNYADSAHSHCHTVVEHNTPCCHSHSHCHYCDYKSKNKSENIQVEIDISEKTKKKESKSSSKVNKVIVETDVESDFEEDIDVSIDISEKCSKTTKETTETGSYKLSLHPNHVNQQPRVTGKCKVCRYFCFGACLIPFNPNARFKSTNFRLYPDYDFFPDNHQAPKDTAFFPKTEVDINRKWIRVKVKNYNRSYLEFMVDIFGDVSVISVKESDGKVGDHVQKEKKPKVLSVLKRKSNKDKVNTLPIPDQTPKPETIGGNYKRSFVTPRSEYDLNRAFAELTVEHDFVLTIPKHRN